MCENFGGQLVLLWVWGQKLQRRTAVWTQFDRVIRNSGSKYPSILTSNGDHGFDPLFCMLLVLRRQRLFIVVSKIWIVADWCNFLRTFFNFQKINRVSTTTSFQLTTHSMILVTPFWQQIAWRLAGENSYLALKNPSGGRPSTIYIFSNNLVT